MEFLHPTSQKDKAKTVTTVKQRSFHLSLDDSQLLAEQGIFYNQIGTAASYI
jgi:hypothetical protein